MRKSHPRVRVAGVAMAISCALLLTGVAMGSPATAAPPDSPEERAAALLAQMTLEEKVDMLEGEQNNFYGFYNAPIERLGIPALTMADGPAGVRIADPRANEKRSTALPAPIALAATFDTAAATQFGDVIGDEAFKTGHNVSLGTAVDIARVGVAGRAFETYGEDPLLSGIIAGSQINAIQQYPVAADIKHFAAYNQEDDRLTGGNAVVGERALQEIYVRPFDIGIDLSNPASAMCAFNKVNFIYACENSELLTQIMREQLDFQGWVMSDYGATHSSVEAMRAGLDQEQPSFGFFNQLVGAVQSGQVAESEIDVRVLRVLTPMFRLGLFDNPAVIQEFDEAGHAQVSQKIAEEGMVLLKNDGILPLSADEIDSVAVIGADADNATAGGGSSLVLPTSTISPLQGIRDLLPDATVEHVRGSDFVTSSSQLPGADVIPSDYLTNAAGDPGVDVQVFDANGALLDAETQQNISINGGFFYFEGFNSQNPSIPTFPGGGIASATFSSTLTPTVTGTYQLELGAWGVATVQIDGTPVLSVEETPLYSTNTVAFDLVAGQSYDVQVEYTASSGARSELGPQLRLGWVKPEGAIDPQAQAAAELAAASDLAVVVVRDYGSEGGDKADLGLPNGQEALIEAVSAVNPNTVVVLTTGGPTTTAEWEDGVPAVLEAWYGGQNQGAAIASILFGDVSPSGKLPVTFPVSDDATPINTPEQYPGIGKDSYYTEGVFVGYRGYEQFGITPKYPFGHGLSYTTFDYSGLAVKSTGKAKVTATFTVTNSGDRAGAETPQVYVGKLPTTVVETAPKQLAGFTKVSLEPGESKTVTVELARQSFSYWDSYTDQWVTPRGDVDVLVGASSGDIRLEGKAAVKSSDKENQSGISNKLVYTIVNENSGACLDAKDHGTTPGTEVQQWACPAPQPNAVWHLGSLKGDWFRITGAESGLALQVAGASTAEGAPVELSTPKPRADNQLFKPVRVGDGQYQFVAKHSGLCLAVQGGSRDNGALVVQQACDTESAAQSFALNDQGSASMAALDLVKRLLLRP
ncbi:glycoside hydrolase family 3 C-terminal domain-containing protein [Microbacterium sp. SS28]|uniref:glycoside hydrolase family 3 C-terminal domain-containing protein n=1 Tax=Microbacterium sp. SS28 TaxID=2919948 RepID=UPI001FAAE319|nr:glycoside hydrolase family 3 C-terminal domain-containing protein [Microbacterium sp. SS28]